VHILHGDLDSHVSLNAAAKKTAELTGGALDYLIVNGVYSPVHVYLKTVEDFIDEEDVFLTELKQTMQTNVGGTLFAFNAFLPLILKSNIRRVAAISSMAALRDYVYDGEDALGIHYATSKAAMNILVAKFAARYKHEGVRFVSLSPGSVKTHPEIPEEFMELVRTPLRRFDPEFKGQLSPAQSVEMCLQVIDELKQEQSGEFLSHHGNKTLWLVER
jgi:NAD(P)-dependent dehydrogenase (short-subunit alcohol dehydrogenase family)